jgi:hypothetical protein
MMATFTESLTEVRMTGEQRELMALCRRAYRNGRDEPDTVSNQQFYPCVQKMHDRVVLLSGSSHPEIVATAMFRPDGRPIHFDDWRTDEHFMGLS